MTISAEIELKKCSLTFGVSPCTASGAPCYNTRRTCKDAPNFTQTTEILKLPLAAGGDISAGGRAYLLDVQHTSQKMTPDGLSDFNDRIDLTIQDAPAVDDDDPYAAQRTRPAQGSWWSRLLARQPYLVGNKVTVDVDNVRSIWEISSIAYPNDAGVARLALQSPIPRFLDTHIPSENYVKLAVNIAAGTTASSQVFRDVLINSYIRIGDEIIQKFTANGFRRGQFATTQVAHTAGSSVIPCLVFANQNIARLCYLLLVEAGAGEYVSLADFQAEETAGIQARRISHYILEEPTTLGECLKELLPLAPMSLVWDAVAGRIKPRALTPWTITPTMISDNVIDGLHNTPKAVQQSSLQATRVYIKYGRRTPTDGDLLDVSVAADLAAEHSDLYGRNFDYELELSRLPRTDGQLADSAALRILHRRNNRHRLPVEVLWTMGASYTEGLKVGDVVDTCFAKVVQNINGDAAVVRAQITSAKMRPQAGIVEFRALSYLPDLAADAPDVPGTPNIPTPDSVIQIAINSNVSSYDLRTAVASNLPVRIKVTIAAGVTVSGVAGTPDADAKPAFSAVGFHPESEIEILLAGDTTGNSPSKIVGADGAQRPQFTVADDPGRTFAGVGIEIGAGLFIVNSNDLRGTVAFPAQTPDNSIAGGLQRDTVLFRGGARVDTTQLVAVKRGFGGIVSIAAGIKITGEVE